MDPAVLRAPDDRSKLGAVGEREMRASFVLAVLALAACNSATPVTPPPIVPTNPLVAFLASEPSTYVMTRLGPFEAPPYMINESVCSELPYRTEIADSIFFGGDGTYRRVYRAYNLMWRTSGVSEPVEMNVRYKIEQKGTVGGEGELLILSIAQWRQNDEPFAPYIPVTGRTDMAFSITGALFSKPETLGRGCNGERVPVTAEFTRIAE
jgi:hypothetical protein